MSPKPEKTPNTFVFEFTPTAPNIRPIRQILKEFIAFFGGGFDMQSLPPETSLGGEPSNNFRIVSDGSRLLATEKPSTNSIATISYPAEATGEQINGVTKLGNILTVKFSGRATLGDRDKVIGALEMFANNINTPYTLEKSYVARSPRK